MTKARDLADFLGSGADIAGTITADGLTVDTNTLYVDSTNNRVGIGTSSPIGKLDVSDGTNPLSIDSSTYNEIQSYNRPLLLNRQGNNVGIGTSSPVQLLHLAKTGITGMRIEDLDAAGGYTDLEQNGSAFFIDAHDEDGTAGLVVFRTAGTERMRIDASGNVGIGKSIPTQKLDVAGNVLISGGNTRKFYRAENMGFSTPTRVDFAFIGNPSPDPSVYGGATHAHEIYIDGDNQGYDLVFGRKTRASGGGAGPDYETMRLDSSGNLLLGKTSADNTTVGTTIYGGSSASVSIVRSGASQLILNRLSNDGDMAVFRKDGTTVGSIGNRGVNLEIASPRNIEFNADTSDANRTIYFDGDQFGPFLTDDASVDFGMSNRRWKDLYLSGGVYLGGTGAANKLDDYEEGTFTPTIEDASGNAASASVNGFYVKVGRIVYATIEATSINTAGLNSGERLYVDGWPFATSNLTGSPNRTAPVYTNFISFNGGSDMIAVFGNNNTRCAFLNNKDAASHATVSVSDIVSTSASMEFSIVYDTA